MYRIIIPQRPVAKSNMYGVRVIGGRGVMYTTKELEDFELEIGRMASEIIPEVLDGLHAIYVKIFQHGKRSIDIDNSLKSIFDGLDNSKTIKRGKKELQVCSTGIANDKLFQLVIAERFSAEDKVDERIEILIAPYEGLLNFVDLIIRDDAQ